MNRFYTFGGESNGAWWKGVGFVGWKRTWEVEFFRRAIFWAWGREFEKTPSGWRFAVNLHKWSFILWCHKEE